MSLLISLVIFVIIVGLLWWLLTVIPVPAPFANVVRVVFIIIAVLVFIYEFLLPLAHGGLGLR